VGAVRITAASLGHELQSGAYFGMALHAADINGDGFCDLLIGAPYEDIGARNDAGRFYFVMGGASGLLASGFAYDQLSCGDLIEPGDHFGWSFATGNWSGDASGYLDLAVGSPGEDDVGAVAINYAGWSFGLSPASAALIRETDLGAPSSGDAFGHSLAGGNFAGGAHDDLAIGHPGAIAGGAVGAGRLWLLSGSDAGLTTAGALSYTAASKDAAQAFGYFGVSLAAGRFFAGAYRSLAIGEHGRHVGAFQSAGRVIIVRGTAAGLDFTGTNGRILHLTSGGCAVAHDNARFGFSLAAGEFEDPDGFDDVAVGTPLYGEGPTAFGGLVTIYPGGSTGPTGTGCTVKSQNNCSDAFEHGDNFGHSVAFGRFDNTDKGAFVAGAPGEDSAVPFPIIPLHLEDHGQVHVIAPWRQTHLTSYSAVMGSCYGDPLYSVRPFDVVSMGINARIMTLLLAAEHIQAGLDPHTPYIVPLWVASDAYVAGPQCEPPLKLGETVTLRDLMYLCLRQHGTDASFAIADLLQGGGGALRSFEEFSAKASAFVSEMNARAVSLGLSQTAFTNPGGFKQVVSWIPVTWPDQSTAWDMWALGKAALENPSFLSLCGSSVYVTTREGNLTVVPPSGMWSVLGIHGLGIATAWSPSMRMSSVIATGNPNGPGPLVGSLMSTPTTDRHLIESQAIARVGLEHCESPHVIPEEVVGFRFPLANLPTSFNVGQLVGSSFGGSELDNMTFDLHRQAGDHLAALRFELGRQAEVQIGPGTSLPFGIGPFQAHDGYEIVNLDSIPASIRVHLAAGVVLDQVVEPDSVLTLPPFSSPTGGQLPDYSIAIENLGLTPTYLSVHEHYVYELANIPPPDPDPALRITLRRVGMLRDGFWVRTLGRDAAGTPGGESMMFLSVHDPDGLDVGIGDPRSAPGASPLRLLPPSPTPSSGATRLGLELAREALVGIAIHDLQGRIVRRLDERLLPAGRSDLSWDGLGQDGRPVRGGLYFFRATLDRAPAGSGVIVVAR
jgi:hypothetical protein